ncbi:MAG TPA: transaminase [Alphaproteobacteria bacterium]|nr:transaminase [Alphaproteobacteria bacterium]
MGTQEAASSLGIDPARLASMLDTERAAWIARHPKAVKFHERAKKSQLNGTPTSRVRHFPPAIPVVLKEARGGRLWDIDGHVYADFHLSGSAALFGHSHPKIVAALREQADRGLVSDWPCEDQVAVTESMQQHFGLPYWQFSLSAADANRFALRLARIATGRQRILVFNRTYHGSLDETHAVLTSRGVEVPSGVSRNGFDVAQSTKVVQFNDLEGARRALGEEDVAAVLVEPAITTRGPIVMPATDFHPELRKLARRAGTLLIVDETQTIAAGPGGFTREFGLEPDMMTLGKWLAGGLPVGMYGMSEKVAEAVRHYGGGAMGSTLAAGAFSVHAMRVALDELITADSYKLMGGMAERYERAVRSLIRRHGLPWHAVRLGARVAFGFDAEPPRSAEQVLSEMETQARAQLHEAIWLFLANRGVLISGWDCTALFCPLTEESDVDLLIDRVEEAVQLLAA